METFWTMVGGRTTGVDVIKVSMVCIEEEAIVQEKDDVVWADPVAMGDGEDGVYLRDIWVIKDISTAGKINSKLPCLASRLSMIWAHTCCISTAPLSAILCKLKRNKYVYIYTTSTPCIPTSVCLLGPPPFSWHPSATLPSAHIQIIPLFLAQVKCNFLLVAFLDPHNHKKASFLRLSSALIYIHLF